MLIIPRRRYNRKHAEHNTPLVFVSTKPGKKEIVCDTLKQNQFFSLYDNQNSFMNSCECKSHTTVHLFF